jgi:hypothetical protein
VSVSNFNRTGPAASTPKDIEDIEAALRGDDSRKPRNSQTMSMTYDPRFSKAIAWVGVILAGVMTWAICWSASATVELEKEMVGVQKDIATLLARPEGVSRQEFDRDADRWSQDIDYLKRRQRP